MSIHEIVHGVNALWQVVAPFVPFALMGGAVVSVILEFAKNWLVDPKHKKAVLIMRQILIGLTVAVHALMASAPDSKVALILRTLLTAGASSSLYVVFLKPLYALFSDAVATYNAGKAVVTPAPASDPQLPTTTHTFEA